MPQFNILIEYSNAQPLVPFDRFQLVQGQYEENNKEWLEKLVTTLVASRIIIPVDSKGKPLIRSPKQRKEAYHVIAAKCKRTTYVTRPAARYQGLGAVVGKAWSVGKRLA